MYLAEERSKRGKSSIFENGKKGLRGSLLTIFFIFLLSISLIAGDFSLEEAVKTGLENNQELVQKYQEIKNLEREVASLEAGLDWTWKLNSNYGYASERLVSGNLVSGDNLAFSLDGGKVTLKGLGINTRFSFADYEPFSFSEIGENYQFRLDLFKRLYPLIPTGAEKTLLQLDNRLNIARSDLALTKSRKEIDWLSAYLNLLRLEKRIEFNQVRYELARENLVSLEKQSGLGEAGKDQVLTAEMAVKEVELQARQVENTFLQAWEALRLDMGIGGELLLSEDSRYLRKFLDKADQINIEIGREERERLLQENNLQLRQIMLNKEYAEKELQWQQEEGKIKIDSSGNYNYDASLPDPYKGYWELSLGLSYEFYDSGEQKLALAGIESRIENLEREYTNSLARLMQELEGMYSQYELDKMGLEIKEISLERARLQAGLSKSQYENGLVTESRYREALLALEQTELDYQEALDKVRFDKLRIALYLGLY
ncbi:MAG TPA: TolC family protein [Halanaerobiaceae bacterium]|jgi:outer membrane protein TolC|nr:TolC family protein [Bacillota bacterium]HHU91839.1 TolC family protein [Halanaerobiaceae bacterium]